MSVIGTIALLLFSGGIFFYKHRFFLIYFQLAFDYQEFLLEVGVGVVVLLESI